jgi:hypothetical protein
MSIRRKPAIIAVVIRRALAGAAKKMIATRRLPIVRHVYAKSKKPLPRECMPGGEIKIDIKSSVHHKHEIMKKRMVK